MLPIKSYRVGTRVVVRFMRRKFGGFPIEQGFPMSPHSSHLTLGLSRDTRLLEPSGSRRSSNQRRRQSIDLGGSHRIPGEGNRESVPQGVTRSACLGRSSAGPSAAASVSAIGRYLAI